MNATENASGQCEVNNVLSAAQCRTTEAIKAYPGVSMLAVFSVGVGIGALVGGMIPFANPFAGNETMSERIGRQVCDALHIKF